MSDKPCVFDSAGDPLRKELQDALHGTAQPLTILRASFGSPRLPRMSEIELRELVRQSAIEVERLCRYFALMEQFVLVESVAATCDLEDIFLLVEHATEGVNVLFFEAGVSLRLGRPEEARLPALADSSRFEQAFSEILLLSLQITEEGDSVSVAFGPSGTSLEISAERAGSKPVFLRSELRLRIALAEANLRTQSMLLSWQSDPFQATIQWQQAGIHPGPVTDRT